MGLAWRGATNFTLTLVIIADTMKSKFLLLIFFSLTFRTFACDCDGEEISLDAAYSKSEIIFTGTVKSFSTFKINNEKTDYLLIKLELSETFKGDIQKQIMEIIAKSTVCGGDF